MGGAWLPFATDNDAPHLDPGKVLGRSLWDFITDSSTRQVYELLLGEVRKGRPVRFPFRCDSPAQRRFLEMAIDPGPGGAVTFTTRAQKIEVREPVPLLGHDARRHRGLLRVCSWCNRVFAGEWVEAEVAVQRLRLFDTPALPMLTHGMCEECLAAAQATIAR